MWPVQSSTPETATTTTNETKHAERKPAKVFSYCIALVHSPNQTWYNVMSNFSCEVRHAPRSSFEIWYAELVQWVSMVWSHPQLGEVVQFVPWQCDAGRYYPVSTCQLVNANAILPWFAFYSKCPMSLHANTGTRVCEAQGYCNMIYDDTGRPAYTGPLENTR